LALFAIPLIFCTTLVAQQGSSGRPASQFLREHEILSGLAYPIDACGAANSGTGTVSDSQSTVTATAASSSEPDAASVPSTYVNSRLPHWLRFSGEFRDREEGRTSYGFVPGDNDAYGLTRVRLGFDVTPTAWLHGFVQARDSEVIGANPNHVTGTMKDVFDLNQAYVQFRNAENGWFSLKLGRQEMAFGDHRLVGGSNWSNASRSFDGARLTLGTQDAGVLLDVFASSVVKDYPTSLDRVQPGHNFYGVNAELTKLVPRVTLEPYFYIKTVPSVAGVNKVPGHERLYTSGLRFSGTVPGGFDYRIRYSFQSGHLSNESIHAWGGYGIVGYTIPKSRFDPRFSLEYSYASGNKSVGGTVVGTFDQLYPTTHEQRGLADLFGGENIVDVKPGFDFKATHKLQVHLMANELSLASRYDGLYDTSGNKLVKVPKGGALSRNIGTEGDVFATYDANRRVQLGLGFGHLYTGQFLKQAAPGGSASYPYGFVDYTF
jgi:hypothetical protein